MPGRSAANSSATEDPAEHEWMPIRSGSRPNPALGRGDRQREILLLEKTESEEAASASPVAAQVRQQDVVSQRESARRLVLATRSRSRPCRGERGSSAVAPARRARRRWRPARRAGAGSRRGAGSPTIGAAAERGEQLVVPVRRRAEPARREETVGERARSAPRTRRRREGRPRRRRRKGGGARSSSCWPSRPKGRYAIPYARALLRFLPEDPDDFDRALHVRLAGQAHRTALPALPHEGQRLGEPEGEGESLALRRGGQVLSAGDGEDGARAAQARRRRTTSRAARRRRARRPRGGSPPRRRSLFR